VNQYISTKTINIIITILFIVLSPTLINNINSYQSIEPKILGESTQITKNGYVTSTIIPTKLLPTMTITPTTIITPTYIIPTPTTIIIKHTTTPPTTIPTPIPTQDVSSCPIHTQNCIVCNVGEQYCRHLSTELTGYLGWACQNNNPGNIRPSDSRNAIIINNGGVASCGDKGGYMIFATYTDGFNGLKAYITGISHGQHSAYIECLPNGNCNLKEFFFHYAPVGDQNDPDSYANIIATQIGVDVDTTTLRWIVDNKLNELAGAIQQHEGWFVD